MLTCDSGSMVGQTKYYLNYKRENRKPGRHHLNQIIKINIASYENNQQHMLHMTHSASLWWYSYQNQESSGNTRLTQTDGWCTKSLVCTLQKYECHEIQRLGNCFGLKEIRKTLQLNSVYGFSFAIKDSISKINKNLNKVQRLEKSFMCVAIHNFTVIMQDKSLFAKKYTLKYLRLKQHHVQLTLKKYYIIYKYTYTQIKNREREIKRQNNCSKMGNLGEGYSGNPCLFL